MRFALTLLFACLLSGMSALAAPGKDFYQIRIYRLKNNEQLSAVRQFLKDSWVPAVHRAGIGKIGVFEPVGIDTASVKFIYIIIPFRSEKEWRALDGKLLRDEAFVSSSQSFRNAPADRQPYERMESILLKAFEGQKRLVLPAKKGGTVFELRSYESPTERLHEKKVAMFENEEIALFKKLSFNVVFYARVVSGSHMPNFMYMPSFSSVDDRNAHWKTFGEDPQWKEMSARPENENKVSVSHIDSILMQSAGSSDW